jgi:vancomycin resistance protein YoaR
VRRGLLHLCAAPALALALCAQARAQELSRFSCERPQPWEAGALKNVSLAAAAIDGLVLQPGEDFSFNKTMAGLHGGFVPGTSYLAGREVKSVGGGICQVSSGLYNAALLAGLDVLERSSHSLYDPAEAYVEPGRDAMVTAGGGSDFRFRNSTAAPLAIHASAKGGRLDITLTGRQRHPRRRWIESKVLARDPMRSVEIASRSLAPGTRSLRRPGFDGLTVAVSLCWAAPGGTTRSAALGVDHYGRVDEEWSVAGPERKP